MARLVAIGDSLTQGFSSLAISQVDLSYPAMIARCMGVAPEGFRVPDFRGSGGLPLNLEWLARELARRNGTDIDGFEWLASVFSVASLLDEVEDYWERGAGSRPSAHVDYHNLAVWGFEVGDATQITGGMAASRFAKTKDDFLAIPSEARMRTAAKVLNPRATPTFATSTQAKAAARIAAQDHGIDHLIVWIGANNALGTVVRLAIRETGAFPPGPFSNFTLWSAGAFEVDYLALVAELEAIDARHVYLATVPHVTIPPLTRGMMANRGVLPASRKYFDYYAYFFVHDKDFDPASDPHLTREQAEHIDRTIDEYNATIRRVARTHANWHVVDTCALLDGLAVRRNHGKTTPLPPAIADLSVRFFETNPGGKLKNGGLISLDGVHPTTCGYGLCAQLFIDAIRPNDAALPGGRPPIRDVDFTSVRGVDSLVSRPPRTLDDVMGMLKMLEARFHLMRWFG